MKDRLPPHDSDAEMAIIGCCVTTPVESMPESQLVIMSPEYFYDLRCRTVWQKISEMNPHEVNLITVHDELIQYDFLNQCQDLAVSSANLPSWLAVVEKRFIARQIIRACTAGIVDAYENESSLDNLESSILKIRPSKISQDSKNQILSQAIELIEFKSSNWDKISGFSTGLVDLDRQTDGLHVGEFIVIAALPSCGKTALAVNIAQKNAMDKIPAGIFSAEMRPVQLIVRSICSDSRVNFRKITESDIPSLTSATHRIAAAPLHIESASGYTITQLQAAARRMKQKHGVKIIVVDYIQLLTGNGDNREQQVASISRGLKSMALELGVCVIGLSQVNDEGRLRESRAIGQDADSIWLLENEGAWQPKIQPIKLSVQKSRDGETGEVKLTFLKEFTKFESIAKFNDD